MNERETERRLRDWLDAQAPTAVPDNLRGAVAAIPATVPVGWPDRLAAAFGPRRAAVPRSAWVLLLLAGLVAAMVAGTLLVGSQHERKLPVVMPPVAPAVACPAGTNPDRPGPAAQIRPALGGGTSWAFDRRAGRLVALGPTDTALETWTFDVCTNAWTQMHPARAPSDWAAGLVYDVDSDVTIGVFSGTVWAYDLGADAWTEKGRAPIDARLLAYDPGSGLVVAAPDREPQTANAVQLWSYDIATDTWAPIGEASAQAAGSHGEAYAFDASADRLIVYSVNESANQTWLFDPRAGTWARSGADTPTIHGLWGMATVPPALVFDDATKRTLVSSIMGGIAAYDATVDGWEHVVGTADSDQAWARFGPSSGWWLDAYDPVNRRLIGSGAGNSLWAFDPANRQWTVLLEGEAGTEPTDFGFGPFVPAQPGSAPDLEAMLPSDVNDVTFTKTSVVGGVPSTRLGKGGWGRVPLPADMLGEFLHAYGRTLPDLNIAIAIPTEASKADTFCIAFRVKGADATELAATLAAISGLEAVTATVGGKQVQVFRETGGMGFDLYVKGDVVFYVFTDGTSLIDGIVAALP
jgi:hypothetical protein